MGAQRGWCIAEFTGIKHIGGDAGELLQQVGELLREYEEEFLVAESAHEVFDVLGLHGAIGGAGLEPWLGGA
jgi:hypothetical protein